MLWMVSNVPDRMWLGGRNRRLLVRWFRIIRHRWSEPVVLFRVLAGRRGMMMVRTTRELNLSLRKVS